VKYAQTHSNKTHKGYSRGGGSKTFDLSKEDFIAWYKSQEKKCAYCDISESTIQTDTDPYHKNITRLTVDCKDNNIGYETWNMVLCCGRCNSTKSDFFTFEEMRIIGQTFIKPNWQKRGER